MNLPNWTYLFVFVMGMALGLYLMKGCNNEKGPDHSADKINVDSIGGYQKKRQDSLTHYIDSVNVVNKTLQGDKDSLVAIIVSYEKNLEKQSNDVGDLLAELSNAEAQRDTSLSLSKCDSLARAVLVAKATVGYYISNNDSLRRVTDQIIASKTEIAQRLNQQFTESNQALFSVQLKYDQLYNDYKKINVKPKRWGIGPGGGVFVTNNGIGYGVGFTLHYDLIKF